MYTEIAKIYGKDESPVCENVKKEKEIVTVAVVLLPVKVMTIVCDKCLVKMEKACNCGWTV